MPVTVLRPDADRAVSFWLTSGASGTNLYAVIDDIPDDTSTFIAGNRSWPEGYYRARLQDIPGGVPAGQRIRALRIRVLASSHADGQVENVYYTLRDPSVGAQSPRDSSFRDAVAWSPGAGIWRTTSLLGREWGQADVAKLEVELFSKDFFARIAEVYVDVDLRALGTLSGVVASEETIGSRPLVSWSFTPNSDGDGQTAYQVKVYTAAQAAAAGFDPATAPNPAYDSGPVGGNVAEHRVGVDLTNGLGYVAFVRVSQPFNDTVSFVKGVGATSAWWTGFASDPFTMAFTPPPMPTLAATPDFVAPSHRVLLEATVQVNQLGQQAANFENASAATDGWLPGPSTTLARSTAQASAGAASMTLTRTGSTGTASATTFGGTSGVRVTPGATVNGFLSFRAAATGRSVRLLVNFYDDAGAAVAGALIGASVTDTTTGFTQASVSGPAPAGAAYMQLQAEVLAAAAAEVHYVDQAALGVGLSGWSEGAGDVGRQVIEYCDQRNTHQPSTNLLHPQLASAGDTLASAAGFYPRTGTVRAGTGIAGGGALGEDVLTWSPAATGFGSLDVGSPMGGVDDTFSPPAYAGQVHTFSAYARILSGSATVRVGLQAIDGAGAAVGATTAGAGVALSTAWTRLVCTASAPVSGAAGWRPFFERTAGTSMVILDRLQLELPAAGCDPAVPSEWEPGSGMACGWQPVRGALTALGIGPDGVARIYDREIPPAGVRLYRARNELAYADGTISSSPWTAPLSVAGPPAPGQGNWILKDPYDPTTDSLVCVTSIAEEITEDLAEFHPIRPDALAGFGQRPVIASDWISGDNGSMVLVVVGDRTWWTVRQLLGVRRPLLLQLPEGGQRFVRFTSRGWPRRQRQAGAAGVDWHRQVTIGFVESDRPRVLA